MEFGVPKHPYTGAFNPLLFALEMPGRWIKWRQPFEHILLLSI